MIALPHRRAGPRFIPGLLTSLLALSCAVGEARLRAETVTLRPVADTSLFELSSDNNLGAVTELPAGTLNRGKRCRLLVRFDLAAALPPDAVITNVSLAVTVSASGTVDSMFELRRVLQAWEEGAQGAIGNTGEPASEGEATWLARAHPGVVWGEPGGQEGADFAATASAALLLGAPASYEFANSPTLLADVQRWLAEPAINHGWLLMSGNEATAGTAKRIRSRDSLDGAPALTLQYDLPVPPPRITSIELVGDEIRLRFPVSAGRLYAVEYSDSLPAGTWQTLAYAASKFEPTVWVATDSRLNATQRFYRLAMLGEID